MTTARLSALTLLTLLSCAGGARLLAGPVSARAAWRAGGELPAGVRLEADVPYGPDPRQRFDVYAPKDARSAPVVFMVHGGAWRIGDKRARGVVDAKVARWVSRGVVLISTNYRMLPEADALAQADDVARALAAAQAAATRLGGDCSRFVLMGHSAGAQLVALLAANPERALRLGAVPWLGTVALDSAALDVVEVMRRRHARFYDEAFGSDPARWRAGSPFHELRGGVAPLLAVCSSRRPDSCRQAEAFAQRARALGDRVRVLPQDLSHRKINVRLGEDPSYTREVESFLAGLDPAFRRALAAPSGGE
jgi:arylformamidase